MTVTVAAVADGHSSHARINPSQQPIATTHRNDPTHQVNKNAGTSTTVLPDYNTSVNVADIKLTKAKRPGSWKGLDDLKQVRRNAVAKGPRG